MPRFSGTFPNGIKVSGVPFYGSAIQPDSSGSVYFVDGNCGSDANTGKSWEDAFATVAKAITVSHADIARGSDRWARRNTIFIAGDDFEEDLVALPQKTDIIGVGSSDNYPMACIRGNHAPVNSTMGCRIFNVRFRPAASSDLWTLASTTGSQIEFHNCLFDAHYGAYTAPSAIDTTACPHLKVINCDFLGAFSGDVIDIGAGDVTSMRIIGNTMLGGADNGIVATGTMTVVQGRNALVAGNYIQVADKVIDDGADNVLFSLNNVCVSAENAGSSAYVITAGYGANNIITCGDGTVAIPSCNFGEQS
jgi:hypothetical protein